jgi:hypothetical protein
MKTLEIIQIRLENNKETPKEKKKPTLKEIFNVTKKK